MVDYRHERLERKYESLLRKFKALDEKYSKMRVTPTFLGEKIKKAPLQEHFTLVISMVIGLLVFVLYRQQVMLEVGLILALIDVYWELHGTGKGWWSYKKSVFYDIRGSVPIEIPVTHFFLGIIAAGIVLFLAGIRF